MDDLGVSRVRLIGLVLSISLLPVLVVVLLGVEWPVAAGVGLASLAATGTLGLFATGFAYRQVLGPLRRLLEAVDDLEEGRIDYFVGESGIPLLHDVMRKVGAASMSIASREQMSQARLLSVETAFARIQSVIQSLHDGVIVVDRDDRVVLVNTRARTVLKSDQQKLEGQPVGELLEGRLREVILGGLEQVHSGRCDEVKGSCLEHEDRFFNLTVVKAITTVPDQDFGTIVVLSDITASREVSSLKEKFLSGVSHELRTPLTSICSSVELLGDSLPPEEIRKEWSSWSTWEEFLGVVTGESRRMKRLVDDLLEYTQTDASGGLERERKAVDLVALAREVIETFADAAKEKSIVVEHNLPAEAVKAWTDGELIRRVLERVIDNAVKFTPQGGRVQVTVRQVGDLVEVDVADSGSGIPKEHREAVFNSFSQLGDLMTDKPKGTGLGLTICRHTLEALNGMIWCEESELGGASFHFILPATPTSKPASGIWTKA